MKITLKPISASDAEPMLDILTSKEVARTYMLPDYESREAALPLFRRLMDLSRQESRFVRGIYQEDQLVGFLNDVEISGSTVEIGYAVHPDHWGKGCMTEGLKLAINDLFRLGYQEVICGAFSHNAASIRVMEKAGMVLLPKTEEIPYRGSTHFCVYYGAHSPTSATLDRNTTLTTEK